MSYRALVTDKDADGRVWSSVQTLDDDRLPPGEVTVDVEWAGLNYKDGLCLTGGGALVRSYPHVAGIDFAGTVRDSEDDRYLPGSKVVLTGWRVGETHWGGFSQRARVKADWLVPLPQRLDARSAMIAGTAGLTAMLSIARLEHAGLVPGAGPVLVTGAAGGVGSIAVALLARLGFEVAALSGRLEQAGTLEQLGARTIVDRTAFLGEADKPLETARWAAAIDTVGGPVLGKLLRQVRYGGAVAAVGNAGGIGLETNVLPFILRGIALIGIDSVMQPFAARLAAWARLAATLDFALYAPMVEEIGLAALPEAAACILAGQVRGRVVVDIGNAEAAS